MDRRIFTKSLATLLCVEGSAESPARVPEVAPPPCSTPERAPALGLNADLNGMKLFSNSEWYRDISGLPVHPDSSTNLKTLGSQVYSQEAGGWTYSGKTVGIPYYVVDSRTQEFVPVVCSQYLAECDLAYAPIPLRDDIIEGYPGNAAFPAAPDENTDRHVIVVDRYQCLSYELFKAYRRDDHWYCATMSVWDLDGGDVQRPFNDTSADVAGLSIMAGLILGHQVTGNKIDHAFRFTIQHQCPFYVSPPAGHASSFGEVDALPFGGRIRLKASVSESSKPGGGSWNLAALRIVRALKKFGMINADTGLALSSQGDTSRWDEAGTTGGPAWQDLRLLRTGDFEVVDTGGTRRKYGVATQPQNGVVASLRASTDEIRSGQTVALTPKWSGNSVARLTPIGHALRTRQKVVDTPVRDAWYHFEVVNPNGRIRKVKRVIVTNGPRRYDRYDRYVGPGGSLSNAGLTPATAWPIEVLASRKHRHLVAGYVIGLLDGIYNISSMTSVDYDYPLLQAPTGMFGRPTVLQALGPRRAIISGGSNPRPMLGSRYQQLSQIQLIGLTFRTQSAPFALYFTGDGAFLIDDCEFSGFQVAAIRANGVTAPLVRGNRVHNTDASWMMLLSGCSDVRMRNNTLDVPGRHWSDWGGNDNAIVVD